MKKTFTLTLNQEDMEILNQALVNLPYKYAASIIQKINQQIQNAANQDVADSAEKHGSELM